MHSRRYGFGNGRERGQFVIPLEAEGGFKAEEPQVLLGMHGVIL